MLRSVAFFLGLLAAASVASAGDIRIEGAFARSSTMMSQSGAAFMVIHNDGAADDRLVAARADFAARVELHTHVDAGGGVMRMVEVEEGFAIPAGGSHALARGGDHVMFLGLAVPFEQGAHLPLTLVFERAGEMTIELPVEIGAGQAGQAGHGGHGASGHGMGSHGSSGN